MYHEAKHSFASHGVKFSSVEVDLPAMMAQKDKAVSNLTRGIEGLFKKNKVNYVKGYGKFVSPSEVSVDTLDGGNTMHSHLKSWLPLHSCFQFCPRILPSCVNIGIRSLNTK